MTTQEEIISTDIKPTLSPKDMKDLDVYPHMLESGNTLRGYIVPIEYILKHKDVFDWRVVFETQYIPDDIALENFHRVEVSPQHFLYFCRENLTKWSDTTILTIVKTLPLCPESICRIRTYLGDELLDALIGKFDPIGKIDPYHSNSIERTLYSILRQVKLTLKQFTKYEDQIVSYLEPDTNKFLWEYSLHRHQLPQAFIDKHVDKLNIPEIVTTQTHLPKAYRQNLKLTRG